MNAAKKERRKEKREGAVNGLDQPMVQRYPYDPSHRVVAITGAHSFLGSELIARLETERRYRKVIALDMRRPNLPLTKTQFHRIDLTLPNADGEVAHILKREGVDTLVHLAFLSKPTHNSTWAHELEAIGTLHVLNACAASKVRKVVLWSQTALYGASPLHPNFLTEKHKPKGIPGSRFFADKLEAERLAKRFRNENQAAVVTILRTAQIVGRRIDNYVSHYLALPLVPVLLGYDPLIQLLHEEDAIDAFHLSVDSDFDGEFNIASAGVLPLNTLLAMAGRVALPLPHFIASPLTKLLWMTQIFDAPPDFLDFLRFMCIVDTEKARNEMGFVPRYDIRQVIAEVSGMNEMNSVMDPSPQPSSGEIHAKDCAG
jgi:UDP-glucose 4-epimerase